MSEEMEFYTKAGWIHIPRCQFPPSPKVGDGIEIDCNGAKITFSYTQPAGRPIGWYITGEE